MGIMIFAGPITILICLTGLVIALATRAKHRRRSTLAALAFASFLLGALVYVGWPLLQAAAMSNELSSEMAFHLIAGFGWLTHTVGLILILILLALLGPAETVSSTQYPPVPGVRPHYVTGIAPYSAPQYPGSQYPGQQYPIPHYQAQPPGIPGQPPARHDELGAADASGPK